MRLPTSVLLLATSVGCPGGEPVPIVPDETGNPDSGDTDTDTDTVVDTPIAPEWDPDDFYTIYDVGPEHDYASPCELPWVELEGGTMVRIHWQDEPYRCKWVITTEAYENHPLVVMGVPDDEGRLPVISGEEAVSSEDADWFMEDSWVVKIGGEAKDDVATWIYLHDLELTGAQPSYRFTSDEGNDMSYTDNVAALRIEQADEVHLYGLDINDAHTGLRITADASNVLVSDSWLHDNGSTTTDGAYNASSEAVNVTYEYSRLGPMRDGAQGHNLVDRSAGLVVRYNWIEGGYRQLELVHSNDPRITGEASYQEAFVYGNVLVEPGDDGSPQLVHYGGSTGDSTDYRPGTLWFFHNTVLSQRSESTTLFVLPTENQQVDARNNVFHATAGEKTLYALLGAGPLTMSDNWFTEGWISGISQDAPVDDQGSISGEAPGFEDLEAHDLRLAADSPCQGAAGEPASSTAEHPIEYQYEPHAARDPRSTTEDLGAFEG